MGKKKDGKGFRIPKEVAGIKVPKGLRRAGKRLAEKANSPEGQKVIATGLGLIATAATIAAERRREKDRAAQAAANDPGEKPKPGHGGTQDHIGDAVDAILTRVFAKRQG